MKSILPIIIIILLFQACKAPEIKELKAPEYSSSLTLDKKFSLTDPMVHVGLQTAIVTNDGTVLANENENIKVWNYDTKTLLQTLKGHQNLVIDMVLSTDETKLYSAGLEEGDILVWDWKQGTLLKRLQGHTAQVNCMRISADGKFLASVSMDGTIKIWDAQNLTLVRTITGIEQSKDTKVTICNDAKYVAVLQSDSFVVYDGETGAEYWRENDGNDYTSGLITFNEANYMNFIGLYGDILLSADGDKLFFDQGYLASWEVSLRTFGQALISTVEPITSDPLPGEGEIFDPNSPNISHVINITSIPASKQPPKQKSLFFTDNENRLVYDFGIYDFRNNFNSYRVQKTGWLSTNLANSKLLILNNNKVELLNFSATTSSSGGSVVGFPLRDYIAIDISFKHPGPITNVAFNKVGNLLFCAEPSNQLSSWYIPNTSALFQIVNNNNFEIKHLISGSNITLAVSLTELKLYDSAEGQINSIIKLQKGYSSSVALSHSETIFYADSKLFKASDGSKIMDLPLIEGFVLFTNDDKKIVNLTEAGLIKEFDVVTGRELRSFLTVAADQYMRLAISGDDKEVAIATSKEILIYNLTEGKLLGSFPANPVFTLSNTIAFNPKQKVVAVATLDRKIQLWTTTTRQLISEQSFDFDTVHLQYNEDGKVLNVVTLKDYYRFNIN